MTILKECHQPINRGWHITKTKTANIDDDDALQWLSKVLMTLWDMMHTFQCCSSMVLYHIFVYRLTNASQKHWSARFNSWMPLPPCRSTLQSFTKTIRWESRMVLTFLPCTAYLLAAMLLSTDGKMTNKKVPSLHKKSRAKISLYYYHLHWDLPQPSFAYMKKHPLDLIARCKSFCRTISMQSSLAQLSRERKTHVPSSTSAYRQSFTGELEKCR